MRNLTWLLIALIVNPQLLYAESRKNPAAPRAASSSANPTRSIASPPAAAKPDPNAELAPLAESELDTERSPTSPAAGRSTPYSTGTVPPPPPATAAPAPNSTPAYQTPEEIFIDPPSGSGGSASARNSFKKSGLSGWKKSQHFGIWYHHYDVTLDGNPISQPGLLSATGGVGSDYYFDPFYIGYDSNLFAPQILFKTVGLGIYYLFCFFVTAGKCDSSASFATGDRDAGFLGVGGHFGWNFHPVPVRIFAGPEFGIFYSGLTPRPLSTLFVKGGFGFDFSDSFALNLEVRKSGVMNEWTFGSKANAEKASLWLISLSAVIRE